MLPPLMAWRIQDSVIRGDVDNREKGIVRGRIWLLGREEPVVLNLTGNAHPDLAGCLLQFRNPVTPEIKMDESLAAVQEGTIGDLTASRKVRVYDVPLDEALEMTDEGRKPPEHMANCLYLEWFSSTNGRVLIESTDFELEISAPAWRLTPEEEEQRTRDAQAGFSGFMQQLTEAVESARHEPPEDKEWDEFDYELFMRESDARTEKYMELIEKYGDDPDSEEIIAREMGWDDDAEDPDAEGFALDVEAMNEACEEALESPLVPEPHTEGIDWIRVDGNDIRHPLQHRCFEASMKLWHECDELGLDRSADSDLAELVAEYQITGAKLAGALNSLAYGREMSEAPFTVAYLKRALGHLHQAQAALEKVAPKKLLPSPTIDRTRSDLFAIREEIIHLMDEFRGRTS